jgi:5-formyltetrahydrofolate cyclo-ligase
MAPTYTVGTRDRTLRRPGRLRTFPLGPKGLIVAVVMAPRSTLENLKPALRQAALARRDALPARARAQAAAHIGAQPFPITVSVDAVVSGFWPMRSEIDPLPLMRQLAARGAKLALPLVQGRGSPLAFRAYAFGDQLRAGTWGIHEPLSEAPFVAPDLLIVPLAAFDRAGHRIGYGAGYYDMTLRQLRAQKSIMAVGLGFAVQEISAVPATAHDERLDLVLTERELIDCRGT